MTIYQGRGYQRALESQIWMSAHDLSDLNMKQGANSVAITIPASSTIEEPYHKDPYELNIPSSSEI